LSISSSVYRGILLTVTAALLLEVMSDVVVARVVEWEGERLERRLSENAEQFAARLQRAPFEAANLLRRFEPDGREVVAWVREDPAAALGSEWLASTARSAWTGSSFPFGDAGAMEVWMTTTAWERLLVDADRLDLLDTPIIFALALLCAAMTARRVRTRLEAVSASITSALQDRVPQPIPTPNGDVELSEIVRSYNRMTAVAARYLEREQTFTRYAAHELRTPLAAVKVQVERLKAGTADKLEVHAAMERNLERMELVMKALLSLSRGRNRSEEHERLTIVIDEVIRASAADPARSERLTVELTPTEARISDAQLVRQALGNLLDNALRHSQASVALRVYVQGRSLTLRVRDAGGRVDDKDMERLTEPFYRPASSAQRGLGLGLALVDVITRALEGELSLQNSTEGFVATLRLPVVEPLPELSAPTAAPYSFSDADRGRRASRRR
jgi:signal transduction histidine kinase